MVVHEQAHQWFGNSVSGQDLDALFDTSLHTSGKPATAPATGAIAVPASIAHLR